MDIETQAPMSQVITLVPCVKTKQDKAAQAGELYISAGFLLARAYAKHHGDWLILSAKHGVLEPTEIVEPYDETLKDKGRDERKTWAKAVTADLLSRSEPGDTFLILAGNRYREYLIEPLLNAERKVEVPMEGMSMGFQRQWLGQELDRLGVERPRRKKGERVSSQRAKREKPKDRTVSQELRVSHLERFYAALDRLRQGLAGGALLGELQQQRQLPERGVYFFFEEGERRTESGDGPRVVRVGTHAVASGSRSTLWGRLKQHFGLKEGGGNHRGSVFRKLTGASLAQRDPRCAVDSWGQGNTASGEVPQLERDLEFEVSKVLRAMPILWLDINDEASKHSLRSYIERNSIALLSNYRTREPLDQSSTNWLGRDCPKEKIRESHLWNSNHVDEVYDAAFLDVLEQLITRQLEGGTLDEIRKPEPEIANDRAPQSKPVSRREGSPRHGQREQLLEYISANKPHCDDCIAEQLEFSQRQTVNQLARRLAEQGKLSRNKGTCGLCKSTKIVNFQLGES